MIDMILRFLYIGAFSVGGGLASIPLVMQTVVNPGFLDEAMFYNMVAVSESTPGPIGVNLATYIGYSQFGLVGSVVISLAVITPCFFISYFVAKVFDKFQHSKLVETAFYGIRPAVTGMVAIATLAIIELCMIDITGETFLEIFNLKAIALFVVTYYLYHKFKKHPVVYIAMGAIVGILMF